MRAGNQADGRTRRLVDGWADYRRRQWAVGVMTIGFFPLIALIAASVETLTQSDDLTTFFVVPLAVLVFGTWSWFVLFRCPNCGGYFHLADTWRLTSGRRCPHCGLERYQTD